MKYFLDTEFHEYQKKPLFGKPIDTIELISIGIVDENGNEYYAICKEFDVKAAWNNDWLKQNVLADIFTHLYSIHVNRTQRGEEEDRAVLFDYRSMKFLVKKYAQSRVEIADMIKDFIYECNQDLNPKTVVNFDEIVKTHPFEFYGYFADYDWVVFCWLFGRMIDLPKGFPMYCRDLKQMFDDKANSMTTMEITNAVYGKGNMSHDVFEYAHDKYPDINVTKVGSLKKHKNYPTQEDEHNALDDAKWNLKLYNFINSL